LLALVAVGLAVFAYTGHREVVYLTLRADHLERRINEVEARHSTVDNLEADADASATTQVTALSEDGGTASTSVLTLEEINRRRAKFGLPPRTLEEQNRYFAEAGKPPLKETPGLAEPDSIRNDFMANRIEREETQRQTAYSDQELYESRAEGPNRPECEVVRQRAMRLASWLRINFLNAFGCATVEDRLEALERER
jgi:hypothetical protein